MIAFIDVMKDRFGVELVCHELRATEVGFVTARGIVRRKAARYRREHCRIS
jgi:putative transposase